MRTLLNLIKGNVSISVLIWRNLQCDNGHIRMARIIQFINEHPAIVKLDFDSLLFKRADIIYFISQLNSLKHFQFEMKKDENELYRLLNHFDLDNMWQYAYKDYSAHTFCYD